MSKILIDKQTGTIILAKRDDAYFSWAEKRYYRIEPLVDPEFDEQLKRELTIGNPIPEKKVDLRRPGVVLVNKTAAEVRRDEELFPKKDAKPRKR